MTWCLTAEPHRRWIRVCLQPPTCVSLQTHTWADQKVQWVATAIFFILFFIVVIYCMKIFALRRTDTISFFKLLLLQRWLNSMLPEPTTPNCGSNTTGGSTSSISKMDMLACTALTACNCACLTCKTYRKSWSQAVHSSTHVDHFVCRYRNLRPDSLPVMFRSFVGIARNRPPCPLRYCLFASQIKSS